MTVSAPTRGRLLIAGGWSPPRDDFPSTSPANLADVVGTFPTATPTEVDAAVAAARAAYPAWRRTSRILRADCFDRLAQLIKRDTDALAELMARECGKNVTECRAEVVEGLHMVQYVFGTGRMPYRRSGRIRDRRERRLHASKAVGRRRRDHALELSLRRAALDARAEPAGREHGRLQAERGHARGRPAAGGTVPRGRLPRRAP